MVIPDLSIPNTNNSRSYVEGCYGYSTPKLLVDKLELHVNDNVDNRKDKQKKIGMVSCSDIVRGDAL